MAVLEIQNANPLLQTGTRELAQVQHERFEPDPRLARIRHASRYEVNQPGIEQVRDEAVFTRVGFLVAIPDQEYVKLVSAKIRRSVTLRRIFHCPRDRSLGAARTLCGGLARL